MNIALKPNQSLHQLPLITYFFSLCSKKSDLRSSPIIDRMKTLHAVNIRTIKKQQTQSANTLQKYFINKSQYLQTVYVRKQQSAQKVLKSLQNKSTLLFKENAQKLKKHNELYQSFTSLSKDKIKTAYLKEKAKLQSALLKKEEIDRSRYKQVFIKKPNYKKLFLQELGKSQELHKTTIQKLNQAELRRNQIKRQKQNQTKGKLEESIVHAQQYAQNCEQEKEKRFIEKSISKMQKSRTLINLHIQKSRSASETSRKSMQQRFIKAQSKREENEKQTIEKLQQILQQKCKKIQTINERKSKNLESLAQSLKKSRQRLQQQAIQRSRSLMLENELRKSALMHENHEKWKFLTGIKTEFQKVKNKNLYDSQQVSLRC